MQSTLTQEYFRLAQNLSYGDSNQQQTTRTDRMMYDITSLPIAFGGFVSTSDNAMKRTITSDQLEKGPGIAQVSLTYKSNDFDQVRQDQTSSKDIKDRTMDRENDDGRDLLLEVDPKPGASIPAKKKKKKSVSFVEDDEICMIPHLREFSLELKSRLWFTTSEKYQQEAEIETALELLRKDGGIFAEEKFNVSIRGLECIIREEEGLLREENIDFVIFQVLQEQERQRNEFVNDDEQLARVYEKYSEWSKHMAQVRAQIDETYVVFQQGEDSKIQNVKRKARDHTNRKLEDSHLDLGINRHCFNPRQSTIILTFR